MEKQINIYRLGEIAGELKTAREAKGMSQRALGRLVGIPQSHLSKIEQGAIDLRLSSLIQLARALDLELKLVPRKVLPAVDALARSPSLDATSVGPAYRLDDEDA